MNSGGRHIAKERGIILRSGIYKRIKAVVEERPWIVVRALSVLSEADRKRLKWVLGRV